jgi:hypothetical protein
MTQGTPTTRRHARSMSEAFDCRPPARQTVIQGPYRRRRGVDPHRVVGWLCAAGFLLVLWKGW